MVLSGGGQPLKRMKRRVTADLYDFLTFPSSSLVYADFYGGGGGGGGGSFRTNVRSFLTRHALLPPPSALFRHLLTWQIQFRVGDLMDGSDGNNPALVCLDVVEEDVARSRSVYCDQCRIVGWSGHPVCGKRYHFIIKAAGSSIGGYHKPCMCCGDILHLSESKCKSCNHVTTSDDVEDWVYQQLENTSHLLHGVIHANGYGHLLRVNGKEGGSRVLSGHHIMDFWDRLCKLLGARKVSVMDVSKKFGLEYRLLHAIMKGYPWYGDWGYEFGPGSYCVTNDAYKSAVESLSNTPLSIFLSEGSKLYPRLHEVISYYKSLSEHKLVYIRDLFCFLMGLVRDTNKTSMGFNDITCKKQRTESLLCSWTKDDIERVEQTIFRVLSAVSGSTWVSRRSLKGAACKVGSPELLDYCLSELGGKVGNNGKVVSVRLNHGSGAVEYRLQEGNDSSNKITTVINPPPPKEVILQDLTYLYESLLHPQTQLTCAYQALRDIAFNSAEKLLDCKQFVKDYRPEKVMPMSNMNSIYVSCEVELRDDSEEYATHPPPELIVLPSNATLSDFKLEITKAFHDVYLIFRRFQVDELPDFSGVDDSTQIKLVLGSREVVRVRGSLLGKNGLSRFRMERGVERWTVDCSCGAKDDDGERMLACDVCGVWRHTRCSGIRDADPVPAKFVCPRCRSSDLTCKHSGHCKDETMSEMQFGEGLPMPPNAR